MDHMIAYRGKEHVALAAMQEAYKPFLLPYVNNLDVTCGTLMRPPVTKEDENAFFTRILARSPTDHIFAVLFREECTPESEYRYIGHMGVHKITYPERFGTTGSFLFDQTLHGKGCGTEAKLLLLHHVFHVIGLRKLTSEVKAFNGNSLGHLLKCGYRIIGTRRQHHFHNGHYVDEFILEVFRADFEAIWKKYQQLEKLPALSDEQKKLMSESIKK